jgi:hypothetical protein
MKLGKQALNECREDEDEEDMSGRRAKERTLEAKRVKTCFKARGNVCYFSDAVD